MQIMLDAIDKHTNAITFRSFKGTLFGERDTRRDGDTLRLTNVCMGARLALMLLSAIDRPFSVRVHTPTRTNTRIPMVQARSVLLILQEFLLLVTLGLSELG
jgi:hypothetical protein